VLGSFEAAWWGLGWPAEEVQEVAELHAQCVEAAERRGVQGRRDRRSGVERLRGASEGRSGSRRSRGRASGIPEAAPGGRWAGTHGGGDRRRWSRAPVELEVGERWEGPV